MSRLRVASRTAVCGGLLLLSSIMTSAALAEGADEPAYSAEGADTCLRCHDADAEFPVLAIFHTKHGRSADARTPFAQLQCESCHGPGEAHAGRVRRGQERPEMLNFGAEANAAAEIQNAVCLECHAALAGTGWHGSTHESEDVACADCHQVHVPQDPVSVVSQQPAVCYRCHQRQRADAYKASSHPIRYGQMACTACHAPHGSLAEAQLVRATLNDTCYTCHAETRGPFLWEHAPVPEDCSLCHRAHGSNHPVLLRKRAPLLCQQCHSQASHPSVAHTARGLPQGTPNAFLLAGSCMNCHSQVHGSNHPSGAGLSR